MVKLSGLRWRDPTPDSKSGDRQTAKPQQAEIAIEEASTTIAQADLSGVKTYLLDKASVLKANTAQLKAAGNHYYDLAKAANFDYAALWQEQPDEVVKVIEEARAAWMTASPSYEQIEGIVAGVPSMAEYDVILDAGTAGSEDRRRGAF